MTTITHINITAFEYHQRLKHAIRRDALFLTAGFVAYAIVAYVETHASDATIRGNLMKLLSHKGNYLYCGADKLESFDVIGNCSIQNEDEHPPKDECAHHTGILDAGFIITSHIHDYLSQHRDLNDCLAMVNSILLTIPLGFVIYITVWHGDFTLSFRLISTHLFRSLCGWFTYLPPDQEFLRSYYDFPEVFLCLFHQDCTSTSEDSSVPFVTFFSGHIATIVIIANHLYTRKYTTLSILLHAFNWLQALRLLATRGHYSIDLIIGYVVAVFVSSPAEKLGWHFSRRVPPSLPQNVLETFEILVGVRVTDGNVDSYEKEAMNHTYSGLQSKPSTTLTEHSKVQSETSVRVALEIMSEFAFNRS